jgi:hypothetical protein
MNSGNIGSIEHHVHSANFDFRIGTDPPFKEQFEEEDFKLFLKKNNAEENIKI